MLDIMIICIILLLATLSLLRGFLKEIISLTVWCLAIYLAFIYYPEFSEHFSFIKQQNFRDIASGFVIFLVIIIIGTILNNILHSLLNKSGLSSTDRILGAFFGMLKGILAISLLLFLYDSFIGFDNTEWWQESQLIPHFQVLIKWFVDTIMQS